MISSTIVHQAQSGAEMLMLLNLKKKKIRQHNNNNHKKNHCLYNEVLYNSLKAWWEEVPPTWWQNVLYLNSTHSTGWNWEELNPRSDSFDGVSWAGMRNQLDPWFIYVSLYITAFGGDRSTDSCSASLTPGFNNVSNCELRNYKP